MEAPTPKPTTLGLKSSFGFGDRIGLATPGHVDAMKRHGAGIAPIFAQQSIREMTRTGRAAETVAARAAALGADLVVAGRGGIETHGLRLRLGGNAYRIVGLVPCAVLVVRP